MFFSDSLYRNWTGGYISNKINAIRLVIGSWCLLTLVLLNVYNGMLFSFVTTTPRARPLVNSVEDVATNPNVFLILNKGLVADSTISVWTFTIIHSDYHYSFGTGMLLHLNTGHYDFMKSDWFLCGKIGLNRAPSLA